MTTNVHFQSIDMTWATPQDFFDKLNEEFDFGLDPCAAIETAKCENFFTEADDGLAQSWAGYGHVFMNPPYGRAIGVWMDKARKEYLANGTTVVCLVPARTDTDWWQRNVFNDNGDQLASVRFVRGRLKFGDAVNSAPFPSAVVIFSDFHYGTSTSMTRPQDD